MPEAMPGAASVWVAPTGDDSTCARGDSSKPCQSLGRAYALASCGDYISVAPGLYPAQSVSYDATKEACSNDYVTFEIAGGTASFAGVTVHAVWLRFLGIPQSLLQMWSGSRAGFDLGPVSVTSGNPQFAQSHDIVFQNVNSNGFYVLGSSRITYKGGQIGPVNLAAGGEDLVHQSSAINGSNVFASYGNTYDGVFFHDLVNLSGGANPGHTDCFQSDAYMDLTIENSVFLNCADEDLLINIYSTTASNYGAYVAAGHDPLAGGTFVNNWFTGGRTSQPVQIGSPAGADWSMYGGVCTGAGTPYGGCMGDDSSSVCHNISFRNNTVVAGQGGPIVAVNCAAGTSAAARSAQATVSVMGNLLPTLGTSCGLAVTVGNYYTQAACASDTAATAGSLAAAALVNPNACYNFNALCAGGTPFDFHLTAGSAARGKGGMTGIATDIDGLARTFPADAGAAQYH